MTIAEICPCVNVGCPNHGQCDKCISRHMRLGTLNYCSLYTLLPVLEKAIAAVIRAGKYVTYDMKPDARDASVVGTSQVADAVIKKLGK